MAEQGNGTDAGMLPTLAALLQDAAHRVDDILGDPLLVRLLTIFGKVPVNDREVLVGLLEREVQAKVLTDATAGTMTGLTLRPNPNARLYVRVVETEPAHENEKIILASMRAMRLVGQVVAPMRDRWRAATLESLSRLEPDERTDIANFCRDVLALAAEVERKTEPA
jgi:hypothetical protein